MGLVYFAIPQNFCLTCNVMNLLIQHSSNSCDCGSTMQSIGTVNIWVIHNTTLLISQTTKGCEHSVDFYQNDGYPKQIHQCSESHAARIRLKLSWDYVLYRNENHDLAAWELFNSTLMWIMNDYIRIFVLLMLWLLHSPSLRSWRTTPTQP